MTNQDGQREEIPDSSDLPGLQRGGGASQDSQSDVLGLLPGQGATSPLKPLFESDGGLGYWGPRGKRNMKMAVAEVDIEAENMVLGSPTFPIRGDYMKKATKQTAYHTLFSQGRAKIEPLEFWALVIFGIVTLLVVFLIATVYSK